jgi:hypothetical protein
LTNQNQKKIYKNERIKSEHCESLTESLQKGASGVPAITTELPGCLALPRRKEQNDHLNTK